MRLLARWIVEFLDRNHRIEHPFRGKLGSGRKVYYVGSDKMKGPRSVIAGRQESIPVSRDLAIRRRWSTSRGSTWKKQNKSITTWCYLAAIPYIDRSYKYVQSPDQFVERALIYCTNQIVNSIPSSSIHLDFLTLLLLSLALLVALANIPIFFSPTPEPAASIVMTLPSLAADLLSSLLFSTVS